MAAWKICNYEIEGEKRLQEDYIQLVASPVAVIGESTVGDIE